MHAEQRMQASASRPTSSASVRTRPLSNRTMWTSCGPSPGCHDSLGPESVRARKFGRQLRGRFGLSVYEVDERYSTTEAHAQGARDADAAAAAIILEQFLRSLP